MVSFRYPSSVSLCCAQEPQFLLPPRPPAVSRIFPLPSISHPPATHLLLPATAAFVPGSSPNHWDVCLTLPSCIDERSSQPLTLRPGSSEAPFSAMLAAGTAVAVPTAAYYSPVKPVRRWRSSWRCRAARVKAGYSQLEVRKVTYRPPGTEQNLLNEISLSLPEKSFGLIFGRSGSGKTTLLQLLARLSEPTSGTICIQIYDDSGKRTGLSEVLTSQRVGIVFQFPERYFLADTILEEVTFGWPRQKADLLYKEQLTLKLQNAINSVGLTTISLDEDPQSLSGGFKRRLALAIQLVQTPDLLLLDEPLAGLDWKARADVVNLLKDLKKHHTILVVSHDLRELYPLVDRSWRMEIGGSLKEEALPV